MILIYNFQQIRLILAYNSRTIFGTVSTRKKPKLLLRMSAKYVDKTFDQLKPSTSAMLCVIIKLSNEAQPLFKKEKSNLLDYIELLRYWEKLETKVEGIARLNAAIVQVTPDNDADMEKSLMQKILKRLYPS